MTSPGPNNPYYSSTFVQIQKFADPSIIHRSISLIFRLSRPRTWAFPSISLILGSAISGGSTTQRLLFGILAACLITAATNLVNAYADRREDLINQPSRALWLDKMGPGRAIDVAVVLYIAAEVIGLEIGGLFMAVLALGILNSLFYSLPPLRFKANPARSLVSFSGAVALPFLGGMSINGSINIFNPLLWLCSYFMLTYGTVKNLPDYQGDKRAGIKTSATVFRSIRDALSFSSRLLGTPYLLLLGLVGSNMIPPIYLLDLGFAAVLSLILRQMWSNTSPEALERGHTIAFFYAISFLLFTLVLTSPTISALVITMVAYAWTLLVSKVNVDSRLERRDWESAIRA